jgi:hypothetical protein
MHTIHIADRKLGELFLASGSVMPIPSRITRMTQANDEEFYAETEKWAKAQGLVGKNDEVGHFSIES